MSSILMEKTGGEKVALGDLAAVKSFAVIDANGKVLNVVAIDESLPEPFRWRPPEGTTLVEATSDAEPGATFDGAKFIKAERPALPAERTVAEKLASVGLSIAELKDALLAAKG